MSELNHNIVTKQMELGGRTLTLETGLFAPQANMSVKAQYGETVVMANVVANEPREGTDFFPLRVDYEEKLYAGGFIKSSRFVKHEGKPTDQATIAARLIDHAVRPLFPKDFMDEVQLTVTVLSVSPEGDPETLAMIAASAALHASNIPWNGPSASIRLSGKKDEQNKIREYTLNPQNGEVHEADFDLILTGLKNRILAMEGEFNEVSEESFLKALEKGSEHINQIADFIDQFAKTVGKTKYVYESQALSKDILSDVQRVAGNDIKQMVETPMNKLDRVDVYRDIQAKVETELEGKYKKTDMARALDETEKKMVRKLVMEDKKRPDGRKFNEVRPLFMQVGVLPRVHGSAIFQRGLTQALTITTLASGSMEQLIQNMYGEETKRYIHHYYAPAYSVGETGAPKGPGRREIGHGMLAEKALRPVIPTKEEFPYTIRVVSEVLSQNGSSSMASTCGSSLSLMDAGVPIKRPVAGIAIGLMANEEKEEYTVLTDIAGVEDFNGFMDFKLTGTTVGSTAVQMDIKLPGLPLSLFKEIVTASKEARLFILGEMEKVMSKPRAELSKHAPRITQVRISPSQIGTLIGPGGKTIRKITEESGAEIDIDEDGVVSIAATTPDSMQKAVQAIKDLTYIPQEGEILEGEIVRIEDFGAFVQLTPTKDGLLHVSELSHSFVKDPRDVVKEGQKVKVKVLEVSPDGKIRLSKKALETGGAENYNAGGFSRDSRNSGSYERNSSGRSGSYNRGSGDRAKSYDRGRSDRRTGSNRYNDRSGRSSSSRDSRSHREHRAPQAPGFGRR